MNDEGAAEDWVAEQSFANGENVETTSIVLHSAPQSTLGNNHRGQTGWNSKKGRENCMLLSFRRRESTGSPIFATRVDELFLVS